MLSTAQISFHTTAHTVERAASHRVVYQLPVALTPAAAFAPNLLPSLTPARADYRLAFLSRQVSCLGQREVLSGRAKFGVFGAGKEIAQLALARAFQLGDFRAGYYRDQTLLFALGMSTPEAFFAQLYANTNVMAEPASGGRSMVAHFATRLLNANGHWLPQTDLYNSSADISCTAAQMPRLVGLAYASRLYRELPELHAFTDFSHQGDEIAFGTIGNASCAQGMFWEALNAIGLLRAPAIISIWDDEYGISVTNRHQLLGGDLTALLEGFRRQPGCEQGFDLYCVPGWNYPTLVDVYAQAAANARQYHRPALVHVVQMTQPQGHSTSGSHERYKSAERLAWEAAHDPLVKMRNWLLTTGQATEVELTELEAAARQDAEAARERAWEAVCAPLQAEAHELADLLADVAQSARQAEVLIDLSHPLRDDSHLPTRKELSQTAQKAISFLYSEVEQVREPLLAWRTTQLATNRTRYGAYLYSQSDESPLKVLPVAPLYGEATCEVRGFELLQANFDALLARDPRVCIFGEDVGKLGDVNQGVAGLQAKYGPLRVTDTGIREVTIIGQAIGMAMRGLRPIAEIQYLDYILYPLMTLSDDLATLHWRTHGGQKAPVIVRTRGHRLEGIWHAGSPMGGLLHLLRGMHLLVPRNMTQAAGFYNTLLRGDDPALVIELLNGYRQWERLPANLGDFTVPLGVPEILHPGVDVTLVTYGACCRIALEAATQLAALNIEVEVIDVQSLLPFDMNHTIVASLQKTSRLVLLDEDVPGGAAAYMMQQVLEVQNGYHWLDSPPRTITAQPHRPAYGTDGDYFSKPNTEDVIMVVYDLLRESDPQRYPAL
jgi:pyruvate/2-oxoglutarate/acetoin dehydrogenase E1 component/TPP-dependent pyruvate/acetoin dehydrogenase alpha subunit